MHLIIQLEERLNTVEATVSVMNSFTGCNDWFTFCWWSEDEGPSFDLGERTERNLGQTWLCVGHPLPNPGWGQTTTARAHSHSCEPEALSGPKTTQPHCPLSPGAPSLEDCRHGGTWTLDTERRWAPDFQRPIPPLPFTSVSLGCWLELRAG